MTLVMIDRNNDEARREFELTATVPADAVAEGIAMAVEYQALTQCQIVARHFALRQEENAISTPVSGEVQVKAIVTVRLEGGNEKATLDIPAPVETLFRALSGDDNKIVDITNTPLNNFVDNFKTTGSDVALISDGEHISEILRGKKV